MNQDDDERLGSRRNPIVLDVEDFLVLYEAAIERDNFERADFFLSGALSHFDPPWVDA